MGCTHTSRLDVFARVSFNAVLSKKCIYSAKSMIASVSADHYNTTTLDGKRQVLMLFTAPSVWETLLDYQLACLLNCSWCYRDSFASQLATQMQMERLHPKIEMLLTIHSCRVPCIYAQASHCAALQQCAASVHRERVLLTRSPNGWDHFKQRCNSLVDWRMKARYYRLCVILNSLTFCSECVQPLIY